MPRTEMPKLMLIHPREFLPVPIPRLPGFHHGQPSIEQCAEVRNHILKVKDENTIICTRCPAEWKLS